MATWSVGSISDHITDMVGTSNIPSSISGTTLNNMIGQEINFVEEFTTTTIPDAAIPEKYQPSIIDLTLSKLLLMLETQEGGVDSVKLGELSVSSSSKGGNAGLAQQLKTDAILRLKELSRQTRFTRVTC
jgi:hypothetical protein|tara:strand:+ start:734 stop:1123 length:390 start_codon:yes stop_codon:yes gene_type:complete